MLRHGLRRRRPWGGGLSPSFKGGWTALTVHVMPMTSRSSEVCTQKELYCIVLPLTFNSRPMLCTFRFKAESAITSTPCSPKMSISAEVDNWTRVYVHAHPQLYANECTVQCTQSSRTRCDYGECRRNYEESQQHLVERFTATSQSRPWLITRMGVT